MHSTEVHHSRVREEGSAFVISILILFVLTVLGLALMLTTMTEKDIAINHRWGEQAFFNADAALEYGKNVLGAHLLTFGNFQDLLPPPRGQGEVTVSDGNQPWGAARPDPSSCDPTVPGCRDYQYYVDRCPPGGGGPCVRVYIGKVLTRPDNSLVMYDFRAPGGAVPGDLDGDGNAELEGTVTVWVRRPIVGDHDYGVPDSANPNGIHDRAILTAEGTAPGSMGAGAGRNVSLRRLEMTVRRPQSGVEGDEHADITNASDRASASSAYDTVQSSTFTP